MSQYMLSKSHLILVLFAIPILVGCERKRSLTVVTYGGGAYQQSHVDAFIKPFASNQGIRQPASVVWGAEYARLSEMVQSGDVQWDVVEVTSAQFVRGIADNLFADISPPISSNLFEPLPGGPTAHSKGIPNVYWSTVIAYKTNTFTVPPRTWTDFWDTDKFPGERALYDDPRGNLEFALLADGVPLSQLYPLDVDRAFAKLEVIRPQVRVWWTDGTEPVRLLMNNQVKLSSAWSGRIFASTQARASLHYSWAGAAHELDYWVIPRGSKYAALASDFIRFASSPDAMADQAMATAYGPANAKALSKIDPKVLPHLPTAPDNWKVSFVIESSWWSTNEVSVKARWIKWRNQ